MGKNLDNIVFMVMAEAKPHIDNPSTDMLIVQLDNDKLLPIGKLYYQTDYANYEFVNEKFSIFCPDVPKKAIKSFLENFKKYLRRLHVHHSVNRLLWMGYPITFKTKNGN